MGKSNETQRENQYDALRILSTMAVIGIHVIANWYQNYDTDSQAMAIMSAWFRFSVLCFVMLAGAFALNRDSNADCAGYYRKIWRHLYRPTLIVSACYVLWHIIRDIPSLGIGQTVKNQFIMISRGVPEWHLWYMYMMAGIYLLVPFFIRFKKEIGNGKFAVVAVVLCLISVICDASSNHIFLWDIGESIYYAGFFFLGNVIYDYAKKEQSSMRGIIGILTAGVVLTALGLARHQRGIVVSDMPADNASVFLSMEPLAPVTVLATVMIFYGFSRLRVPADVSAVAEATFGIYLIHYFVQEILHMYVPYVHWIQIPVHMAVTFVVSLFLVKIYQKVRRMVQ